MEPIRLQTPLTVEDTAKLRAGQTCLISGIIYTARDSAHKRLVELLEKGEELPFDPRGQLRYYVGPCPAPPGKVIGSAGPTTSVRMDVYTGFAGSRSAGVIGKGDRGQQVMQALMDNKAVYFAAIGGAGALIPKSVVEAEVVAFWI